MTDPDSTADAPAPTIEARLDALEKLANQLVHLVGSQVHAAGDFGDRLSALTALVRRLATTPGIKIDPDHLGI